MPICSIGADVRMNIMLYEPGKEGHRPVYLRYIDEALREAGCDTIVVSETYASAPWALAATAAKNGAQIIFVCTMDGMFGWLTALGLSCRIHGIKVVGIYYLFNNLHEGWKMYLWRGLLHLNLLSKIFTPDLNLAGKEVGNHKRGITFLADPWDKQFLTPMPRGEALRACGIIDDKVCVFLLFGELSERKGVQLILEALKNWDYQRRPALKVLAAGRVAPVVKQQFIDAMNMSEAVRQALVLIDRWIDECQHSQFFCAASYLCALYPKSFKVSISTVIRAFAVGRPVIVGDHGMFGEVVHKCTAGFVCDTSNADSVHAAMIQAYDTYFTDPRKYLAMAQAGRNIAWQSELTNFKSILARWVATV